MGKRGSGKSFLLRKKLSQQTRFVLYNTLGEPTYSEFETVTDFDVLAEKLKKNSGLIRVNYCRLSPLSMADDFNMVCEAVKASSNIIFAVDEIDLHTNPNMLPEPFEYLVSIGRHRGISVWVISRRPYLIHSLIRSQASTVITFNQTEPRDIEWLKQVIGEQVNRLPSLKQYEPLIWQENLTKEKGESGEATE